MVWSSKAAIGQAEAVQVEDGFLRSRGLGAELVPPVSLIVDDMGIYYDPQKPSRLEQLIAARATLRPDQERRAEALIDRLRKLGVNKYNLGGTQLDLPAGRKILVVGQVEDDASITRGAGEVSTNAALLEAARAACPDACLIFKPHPDVEAGLRAGGSGVESAADIVAEGADANWLVSQVDAVWTITSLLGFEALLRGVPVTTLGAPFYAGWRLTDDLGPVPPRRRAEPSLAGLVHASLIDYPRYFDPKTGLPCPVEHAVNVLSQQIATPERSTLNRLLSKLQGIFASHAHRWR
jgi:capsular polysaccharide export protein